ncbi:MAG: sensor histidine kinase [Anaerolineales bacterium]
MGAISHNFRQVLTAVRECYADICHATGWPRESQSKWELAKLLAEYIERFRRKSAVKVELRVSPTWREYTLSPSARIQLLRLVQEALANVHKHAAANHIQINLAVKSGCAQIQIDDDGCGFFLSRHLYRLLHPTFPRHGLCAMRDRARAVGGTFKIESSPGRGTHISVRVPLNALR